MEREARSSAVSSMSSPAKENEKAIFAVCIGEGVVALKMVWALSCRSVGTRSRTLVADPPKEPSLAYLLPPSSFPPIINRPHQQKQNCKSPHLMRPRPLTHNRCNPLRHVTVIDPLQSEASLEHVYHRLRPNNYPALPSGLWAPATFEPDTGCEMGESRKEARMRFLTGWPSQPKI